MRSTDVLNHFPLISMSYYSPVNDDPQWKVVGILMAPHLTAAVHTDTVY
jgi:hypothetical protein